MSGDQSRRQAMERNLDDKLYGYSSLPTIIHDTQSPEVLIHSREMISLYIRLSYRLVREISL